MTRPVDELRARAFFAVDRGLENWDLIRDLAARLDTRELALGEALAALEALADDYETRLGDGVTLDTEPGVLRDAREVLSAQGKRR
jgi:hypothetical protein